MCGGMRGNSHIRPRMPEAPKEREGTPSKLESRALTTAAGSPGSGTNRNPELPTPLLVVLDTGANLSPAPPTPLLVVPEPTGAGVQVQHPILPGTERPCSKTNHQKHTTLHPKSTFSQMPPFTPGPRPNHSHLNFSVNFHSHPNIFRNTVF